MAGQTFKNHRHLPVPTATAGLCWAVAAVALGRTDWFGWNAGTVAAGGVMAALALLIGISRGYTTRLQDRIILLEMKVRCAEVLPAGDDAKLARLTTPQVVALRFASDEELGALLDRAVRETLSPNDIKAAIRTWKPDLLRT